MGIAVVAAADFADVANEVAFPRGCFVPPAAAKDIEAPIAVDVHHGAGTVFALGVEGMDAKAQLGGGNCIGPCQDSHERQQAQEARIGGRRVLARKMEGLVR